MVWFYPTKQPRTGGSGTYVANAAHIPGRSNRQFQLSNPPACRHVWLEGVVLVSVIGLYLFLCSLAVRFCFVWIKVTPPPSTTSTSNSTSSSSSSGSSSSNSSSSSRRSSSSRSSSSSKSSSGSSSSSSSSSSGSSSSTTTTTTTTTTPTTTNYYPLLTTTTPTPTPTPPPAPTPTPMPTPTQDPSTPLLLYSFLPSSPSTTLVVPVANDIAYSITVVYRYSSQDAHWYWSTSTQLACVPLVVQAHKC